jgi:hypothetical protein
VLLFAAGLVGAQVTVNTQVFPPLSPHISDWTSQQGKMLVTLTSPSARSVRLAVTISGNNGVSVLTNPNFKPPQPIVLNPNVPRTLTVADLNVYFSLQQITTVKISMQELTYGNGLPEGLYSVCVRVLDYTSGAALSALAPSGCSMPFSVAYVEPPVIVSPVPNQTVLAADVQNLVLSWTIPAGAPPGVEYTAKMVECMPDNRDPNDAINSATTPAFFERTTVAPTTLYGPADPLLVKGHRYALRVSVRDLQNRVVFKNNGKGAAIAFRYGAAQVMTALRTAPPPQTPLPSASASLSTFASMSTVNGTLTYRYHSNAIPGSWPLADMPLTLVRQYVLKNTAQGNKVLSQMSLSGQSPWKAIDTLAVATSGSNGSFSCSFVAGDSMGLVMHNCSVKLAGEGAGSLVGDLWRVARIVLPSDYYCSPDDEIVVQPGASATVQAQAFPKTYTLTVTAQVLLGTFDESQVSTTGILPGVDVLVLRKERPLAVPSNEGAPKPSEAIGLFGMQVVAKKRTDENGKADISELVKNVGPNDRYYVLVQSDSVTGDKNFASLLSEFHFRCASEPVHSQQGQPVLIQDTLDASTTWGAFEGQPRAKALTIKALPLHPRLAGRVYRKDNPMKPIAGALVELKRQSTVPLVGDEATTTTSDSGAFAIIYNPSGGYDKTRTYTLVISAPGFKTVWLDNVGSLARGSQYTAPSVMLEPQATAFGSIVDEDSCGVDAFVTLGEGGEQPSGQELISGQYQATMSAHDLSTALAGLSGGYQAMHVQVPANLANAEHAVNSQTSNVAHAQAPAYQYAGGNQAPAVQHTGGVQTAQASNAVLGGTGCQPPQFFLSPAIPGQQKIIIMPTNLTRYFPETLSVNITKDFQDVGRLVVHKRLHRLQFRVVQGTPRPHIGATPNTSVGSVTPQIGSAVPARQTPATAQAQARQAGGNEPLDQFASGLYVGANQATVQALGSALSAIAGATVTVNNDTTLTTGADGWTRTYVSTTPSTEFTLNAAGPDSKDYVPRFGLVVASAISKSVKQVTIALYPGSRVSGTVFVGDSTPLAGAHVFLPGVSDSGTITDNQGHFTLRRVPLIHAAIVTATHAAKGDTTFVGAADTVNVTPQPVQGVQLRLRYCNEMDVSTLLGFPVELTDLKLTSSTTATISGFLGSVPTNPVFGLDAQALTQKVAFTNIAVKTVAPTGAGKPHAVPQSLPMATDAASLPLKTYQSFDSRLRSPGGTLAIDTAGGSGVILGKVSIEGSTFTYQTPFQLTRLYLARPGMAGAAKMLIPALTASGATTLDASQGLLAVDSSGGSLAFTLNDFEATADAATSMVRGDTIRLPVLLHTHINHLAQQDFRIGNLLLHKSHYHFAQTSDSVTIPLEKWTIVGNTWSVNQGFVVTSGHVRTGVIDVPFTNLRITPAEMHGTFELTSLPLGPSSTLNVSGTPTFGFDEGRAHWALAVTSSGTGVAATFAGLPGMKNGDHVDVNNFYLLSNGTSLFTIDPGTPALTIHRVVSFKPNMIQADSTMLILPGIIDPGVPLLPPSNAALIYSREGAGLALKLQTFPFQWTANGVTASFPGNVQSPQTLSASGFTAVGSVSEPGKFSLAATLSRSVDSTVVSVNPGQTVPLSGNGARKLTSVTGAMKVFGGSWGNFWFSGDATGAAGATGRLTFTVYGEIRADGQQIGVKNISTPVGDISMVYEPENGRVVGSTSFNHDVPGAHFSGAVEVLFDDQGWYFFSAGDIAVQNPKSTGTAALLIGNYPTTSHIRDVFAQYSYVYQHRGSLPSSFPAAISGIYFEGMTSIPIQSLLGIPNIDIDLVVIAARLWVNAGADFRMGANFSSGNATFSAGMDQLLDAGFSASGSVVVACGGVAFGALVDQGMDGTFSTTGDWSAELTGDLTLYGEAYAGWGLCSATCGGKFCDKSSWSGSKMFGVKGHMGSDGKYVDFYVK